MLRNIRSVCLYFLYVIIPIIIGLTLKFLGQPIKQGFYCLDDSIRYPYVSDTVQWWQVCAVSAIFPLTIILVDALVRISSRGAIHNSAGSDTDAGAPSPVSDDTNAAQSSPSSSPLSLSSPPSSSSRWKIEFLDNCLPRVMAFVSGGLFLNAIVDVVKYSFGRLRPYFISVCQPKLYNGTTSFDSCAELPLPLQHTFVVAQPGEEDMEGTSLWYKCSEIDTKQESRIRKGRQSFPSGHTAVVAYAMAYVFIYMQIHVKRIPIVRNVTQFLCVSSILFVATSRLSDHAHHVEDVLVGGIVGVAAAIHAVRNPLPDRRERPRRQQSIHRKMLDIELAKKIKEDVKP